jgi:FK506-binding protein 14
MAKLTVLLLLASLSYLVKCDVEDVDELKIETVYKPDNCDRLTKKGDKLSMHYTGTLLDGTEFDSSVGRGEPFQFQLGIGQVIKGWDTGLIGMCKGEKRKLTIPSKLAYGATGAGDKIPGGAGLRFDVECVNIDDGEQPVNVFSEIDVNNDNQISREEVSSYLQKQLPEGQLEGVPDQDQLVEEIFQHEDADKNGFISHEEFSGPKHDEL